MTHLKTELYHNRSSSGQFLFCKSAVTSQKDTTDVFSSVGKDFIENAVTRLKSSAEFDAMVVKIDRLNHNDAETAGNDEIDLWINIASVIDTICKHESGMWGRLDRGMLGCFFAKKNQTSPLELAQKIKNSLAETTSDTISIGIASYPTINYKREQILDNAGKAVDHASFYGPDSIVSFDAVSLNISGDNLYQNGDIDGAISEFKTAILLDSSNVNIHNSLGVCYGVLGDYGKALKEFNTALKIDSGEVMALYNIGLVKMLTGKNSEALKYFLNADKRKEADIYEVAFQTGRIYLNMEEPEMAKRFIENAVKLNPESGPALRLLGECCTAMNMTDEAISAYKKAIRKNPNDAESLSALGYLFDLLGENPEITTIFCQQSVDIEPDNGLYRSRLGSLYLKRNQLEDALLQFKKAHDLGHDSKKLIKKVNKLIRDT